MFVDIRFRMAYSSHLFSFTCTLNGKGLKNFFFLSFLNLFIKVCESKPVTNA